MTEARGDHNNFILILYKNLGFCRRNLKYRFMVIHSALKCPDVIMLLTALSCTLSIEFHH